MGYSSTPIEGMIQYLNLVPDQGARGATSAPYQLGAAVQLNAPILDRLAEGIARSPGATGLTYSDAMSVSGLSRAEFLKALSEGVASKILQIDESSGEPMLKLTPSAEPLYR